MFSISKSYLYDLYRVHEYYGHTLRKNILGNIFGINKFVKMFSEGYTLVSDNKLDEAEKVCKQIEEEFKKSHPHFQPKDLNHLETTINFERDFWKD